jgi:putative ABC transport system permease protein
MLDVIMQDVRYAIRGLCATPGFAAVAILSLALGIGANTAIFSLIDSLFLRALPVSHPEQLLRVTAGQDEEFNNRVWEMLRDRQDVFSGIFAYGLAGGRVNLATGGEARYAQSNIASGQFFEALGLRAFIGRAFTAADDQPGCPGTAVLSYDFWQREYEGRRNAVGKTILLDNQPFQVLGVLEPGFTGLDVGSHRDLYIPICAEKIIHADWSEPSPVRIIGRPKGGISPAQVETRLRTLAPQIFAAAQPPNLQPEARENYLKQTFDVQLAANGLSFIRGEYRQALLVLMAIVGTVLLIACANVANLLLARGVARQKDIAIRLALGSGRSRLVRQLLTESLVLSLSGAALGILFAQWSTRLLVAFLSSGWNKAFLDLTIDARVLTFTAGLVILTSLLFGHAPAWRSTRVSPQLAMKANARGLAEGRKFGLGKSIVVLQVALSLVLVVGAGLMLATFFRLETLDPGFERGHVLLVRVDLRNTHYPEPQRGAIFDEIVEHLRALPGVRAVSASSETPIDNSLLVANLQIEGYVPKSGGDTRVYQNIVRDQFFETLGTELLTGRDFNRSDTPQSPKVAIVNQTLATKFFAGQNPTGRRFRRGFGHEHSDPYEIVGVVKDAKYLSLREQNHATVYFAASQFLVRGQFATFLVRVAAASPTSVIPAVKSTIGTINRDESLDFKTLSVQVEESLSRERLLATLSGFFGVLALLLAMMGLYGVMSYNVTRRRKEIGIRIALGADPMRVLRMVMGEVSFLIAVGLAIGLGLTIAATRLVASLLYGVTPKDPLTLSLAIIILAGVSSLAGYLQAHRAAHLEPLTALREE